MLLSKTKGCSFYSVSWWRGGMQLTWWTGRLGLARKRKGVDNTEFNSMSVSDWDYWSGDKGWFFNSPERQHSRCFYMSALGLNAFDQGGNQIVQKKVLSYLFLLSISLKSLKYSVITSSMVSSKWSLDSRLKSLLINDQFNISLPKVTPFN